MPYLIHLNRKSTSWFRISVISVIFESLFPVKSATPGPEPGEGVAVSIPFSSMPVA